MQRRPESADFCLICLVLLQPLGELFPDRVVLVLRLVLFGHGTVSPKRRAAVRVVINPHVLIADLHAPPWVHTNDPVRYPYARHFSPPLHNPSVEIDAAP